MKATLFFFALLFLSGCHFVAPSQITYTRTTPPTNGTVVVEQVVVRQPDAPKQGAALSIAPASIEASTGAAQSEAKRIDASSRGKARRVLFVFCGLVLLLGAIALALPNYLVSNKDALLVILAGLVSMALVVWADAAATVMRWVLPVVVVLAAGYLAWIYQRNRAVHGSPRLLS